MRDPIQVNVSTQSLRKLLEDDPDIIVKLQTMACEKIAQEITEKAKNIDIKYVKDHIDKQLNGFLEDMTVKYRFPAEGKKIIAELVNASVEGLVKQRLDLERKDFERRMEDSMRSILSKFDTSLADMLTSFVAKLENRIKVLAFNEFMEVVKQVKGATS